MRIRRGFMALITAVFTAGVSTVYAQTVVIATNPQGSIQYASGAAVAKVLNQKADIKARIQPSAGSSTYIPMLNRGEMAFGFSNGLEVMFAYNGKGTFEGQENKNLRLVGMVFPLYLSLVVPADSPVKSISELKGMRVGSGFTSQNIMVYVQNALLANGGLTMKDMEPVPVSHANQATMDQAQGRLEVSTAPPGGGVASRAHAALSSQGGIRFLSIDDSEAAVERMKKHIPSAWVATLKPAKRLPGVRGDTNVMAYPYYLITSTSTSDEMVSKVAKTLYENKEALAKSFGVFNRFNPKDMAWSHSVPYHSGALKFYKEVGLQ